MSICLYVYDGNISPNATLLKENTRWKKTNNNGCSILSIHTINFSFNFTFWEEEPIFVSSHTERNKFLSTKRKKKSIKLIQFKMSWWVVLMGLIFYLFSSILINVKVCCRKKLDCCRSHGCSVFFPLQHFLKNVQIRKFAVQKICGDNINLTFYKLESSYVSSYLSIIEYFSCDDRDRLWIVK